MLIQRHTVSLYCKPGYRTSGRLHLLLISKLPFITLIYQLNLTLNATNKLIYNLLKHAHPVQKEGEMMLFF